MNITSLKQHPLSSVSDSRSLCRGAKVMFYVIYYKVCFDWKSSTLKSKKIWANKSVPLFLAKLFAKQILKVCHLSFPVISDVGSELKSHKFLFLVWGNVTMSFSVERNRFAKIKYAFRVLFLSLGKSNDNKLTCLSFLRHETIQGIIYYQRTSENFHAKHIVCVSQMNTYFR